MGMDSSDDGFSDAPYIKHDNIAKVIRKAQLKKEIYRCNILSESQVWVCRLTAHLCAKAIADRVEMLLYVAT